MISIEHKKVAGTQDALIATVFGEFTLADYQTFEQAVLDSLEKTHIALNLILDLRNMVRFTVDVAWEEIQFSRAHPRDFAKIAVVTDSVFISWSAWLSRLFVEADFQVFDQLEAAEAWIGIG